MLSGGSAGGGYDPTIEPCASLSKHVPAIAFVVENMTGAGKLDRSHYVYKVGKPTDASSAFIGV